jgi:hypothetical protein
MGILKSDKIYKVINYREQNEDKIKQFIYPYLLEEVIKLYQGRFNISESTAEKRVRKDLKWEGNVDTTVENRLFLGTYHRPDMTIDFGNYITIAIEIKRGKKGNTIREGIGQSIVYSTLFDFVVYLFIDTSKDKRIFNSYTGGRELELLESLYENYNIVFEVI